MFAGERGSGLVAASYTSADGYRAHSGSDIVRGHIVLDYLASPGTRVSFQVTGSRLDSRLPGSLTLPRFEADPDAAAPAAEAFEFGRDDHGYRAGARVETAAGDGVVDGYVFYGRGNLFLAFPSAILDAEPAPGPGRGPFPLQPHRAVAARCHGRLRLRSLLRNESPL